MKKIKKSKNQNLKKNQKKKDKRVKEGKGG
jgi:hypothetical protein